MTNQDAVSVEEVELLPCPWCGGEATLANDGDPAYPIVIRDTHVEPCPLGFHTLQISYPDEATASEAWNTRHAALRTKAPEEQEAAALKLVCAMAEAVDKPMRGFGIPHNAYQEAIRIAALKSEGDGL